MACFFFPLPFRDAGSYFFFLIFTLSSEGSAQKNINSMGKCLGFVFYFLVSNRFFAACFALPLFCTIRHCNYWP